MIAEPQQGPGDPALAFERLRSEVALLRLAVEGLSGAQVNLELPDYEPTLARTESVLRDLMRSVADIERSPALAFTPESIADRIDGAAEAAADRRARELHSIRSAMNEAIANLARIVRSERSSHAQLRRTRLYGAGGVLFGMLLWAGLAGAVARAAPERWHWPERMAARTMRLPPWEAGERLMSLVDPVAWERILAADQFSRANAGTLSACHRAAVRLGKSQRCSVSVAGERG